MVGPTVRITTPKGQPLRPVRRLFSLGPPRRPTFCESVTGRALPSALLGSAQQAKRGRLARSGGTRWRSFDSSNAGPARRGLLGCNLRDRGCVGPHNEYRKRPFSLVHETYQRSP